MEFFIIPLAALLASTLTLFSGFGLGTLLMPDLGGLHRGIRGQTPYEENDHPFHPNSRVGIAGGGGTRVDGWSILRNRLQSAPPREIIQSIN